MQHIDHNIDPGVSDKTSITLGFIYFFIRVMEDNAIFSESIHLAFSIIGALIIVTISHYYKKFLIYRDKIKQNRNG